MAKVRINTGGKLVMVVLGLAILGVVIWQVIPKKGAEPSVEPEFDNKGIEAASADNDTPAPTKVPDFNGDKIEAAKPNIEKGGSSGSTPGINRPIRVGIVTWGGYAGGIMANNGFAASKDSTFWKEYGVEVELKVIDDYPASRAAFRKGGGDGGVDIVWGTVDSFALEYDSLKDLNPLAFMQYDWSRGGDAIAVTKEITAVSQLAGKRIAVAEGTPSHYFALYLLSQADLKTDQVSWAFTESAIEAAQLFKLGKVDAAVSWSPDVYMAAEGREGGHILASTKEASALIADIFMVRGDFAKQHPELLAKFTLGWLDGVEQVAKDPKPTIQLMANGFEGVDAVVAEAMLGDVKLPNYYENLAFFEVTGDQLRGYSDIFNEATKLWRSLGKISGRGDASSTFDTTFLKAIKPEAEVRFKKDDVVAAAEQEAPAPTKEFKFYFSPEEQKAAEKKEAILTKRMSVYFPSGAYELDENAKFILDEAASLAQTFGSLQMRVVGNTDDKGKRAANVTLSQKRAQSVVNYLVQKHGFPAEKFVVVGAGPDNPIADNKDEEGRKQNRRTDFDILRQ